MKRTLLTGLAAALLAGCADEPTTSRGRTTETFMIGTPRSTTTVAAVTPSVTPRWSAATDTHTHPVRPTPVAKPDKIFDAIVSDRKEFWFEVQAITSGKTYRLWPSQSLVDMTERPGTPLLNYGQIKVGQKLRVVLCKDGDHWRCDSVMLWGVKHSNGTTLPPEGKPLPDD